MTATVVTTSTGSIVLDYSLYLDAFNGYFSRIATALETIAVSLGTGTVSQSLSSLVTSAGSSTSYLGSLVTSIGSSTAHLAYLESIPGSSLSSATYTGTNLVVDLLALGFTGTVEVSITDPGIADGHPAIFAPIDLSNTASQITIISTGSGYLYSPLFKFKGYKLTTTTATFTASVGGTEGYTMYISTITSGVIVPNMVLSGSYVNNNIVNTVGTDTCELKVYTNFKQSLNQGNSPTVTVNGVYNTLTELIVTTTSISVTLANSISRIIAPI
jgi:hypothetical protein